MILILEDEGDREAYGDGSFIGLRWAEDAVGRSLRVWISPEAYAKDAVLADLHKKVAALLAEAEDDVPNGSARASAYAQVLVLIGQEKEGGQ